MNVQKSYYFSRAGFALIASVVLILLGLSPWLAVLAGLLMFAFFVWSARSDRYIVQPGLGAAPLRRDERTQAITNRSARNAFVVTVMCLAGVALYFTQVAHQDVPVGILGLILALGFLIYLGSDLWLRHS